VAADAAASFALLAMAELDFVLAHPSSELGQSRLVRLMHMRTIVRVFIQGVNIGGFNDTRIGFDNTSLSNFLGSSMNSVLGALMNTMSRTDSRFVVGHCSSSLELWNCFGVLKCVLWSLTSMGYCGENFDQNVLSSLNTQCGVRYISNGIHDTINKRESEMH
jgi:hypothetical protein